MSTKKSPVKVEITQDKLVDLLMHTATQRDIQNLDNKIDKVAEATQRDIQNLDKRIDKLDGRIDKLDGRIDKVHGRIDKLDNKMDVQFKFLVRLMLGGFFATSVTIVGITGLLFKLLR